MHSPQLQELLIKCKIYNSTKIHREQQKNSIIPSKLSLRTAGQPRPANDNQPCSQKGLQLTQNLKKYQGIKTTDKLDFIVKHQIILLIDRSYSMNKSYLTIALLLVAAAVLYSLEPAQSKDADSLKYIGFLREFGKPVPKGEEFAYRSAIFAENLLRIERHNADLSHSWKMGVNQFADLTQEEFIATYLGEQSHTQTINVQEPLNAGFTSQIDWRTKGIVTNVKNQGQCGSCWAFAATASHETYQIQVRGESNTINLSEQQLVDCSTASPYGNAGCNGGSALRALGYIRDKGQTTQSAYPYKAVDGSCQSKSGEYKPSAVANISGCANIEEVLSRRPLAVRVDASNWSLYRSGVFSNCEANKNHAVFMVGSTQSYWTIKNSWGTTWGQSGYIRLAKGNTCGVCDGPCSYAA